MSEYAERDIIEQGRHYVKHVSAMTGENLHSKSRIAAELAHRDLEIERLQKELEAAQEEIKRLDSGWNEAIEVSNGFYSRICRNEEELEHTKAVVEAAKEVLANCENALINPSKDLQHCLIPFAAITKLSNEMRALEETKP